MLLETLNDEHFDNFILFTQGKQRMRLNNDKGAILPSDVKTEKNNAE